MTSDKEKNGPSEPTNPPDERLSLEEFKRLVQEAQERGEDTAPIIRRMVLQVIDEVREGLDPETRAPKNP